MPFCPKCRDEFQDWVKTCPDCHVELVTVLPAKPPQLKNTTLPSDPLVTIATYTYPLEAHLSKAKLESEGIDSAVIDEHIINANWLYSIAVGGVKLQVRESDVKQAQQILDSIPAHISEKAGDSAESSDEERCPNCSSLDIHYETFHIRRVFILWLLLYVISLPLIWPFLKKKWKCRNCGYEWKMKK